MNGKNYDELAAGRDTDRLVAEAMGLDVIDYARDWAGVDDMPSAPILRPADDGSSLIPIEPVKRYSTDTHDAITLLDEAESVGMYKSDGGWLVGIGGPHEGIWLGRGETLALAICRAVLRWREALGWEPPVIPADEPEGDNDG